MRDGGCERVRATASGSFGRTHGDGVCWGREGRGAERPRAGRRLVDKEGKTPREGGVKDYCSRGAYRVYGTVRRGVPQGATSVSTLRATSRSYSGRPTSRLGGGLRARRSGVGAFQQ